MASAHAGERADAARNRRKILDAAARLLAQHGAASLSLDDVAAAAGVGVGTIYRRFPDRAALAQALLDEQESQFQQAFLAGPPPLGPNAPAGERIQAFLHAYIDRLAEDATLLVVAEASTPFARFGSGAYRLHHSHLAALIAKVRPDSDAEYLAEALLAPLAAVAFVHQHRDLKMSVDRIKSGLNDLLAGLGITDEHRPS